jgi:hypothetical protein
MARVSIDIAFYKNELLRMSVSVLRTIELDALQIFKAVVDFGGVTRAAAQLHRVPFLVWPREHRSAALGALRRELGQENAG